MIGFFVCEGLKLCYYITYTNEVGWEYGYAGAGFGPWAKIDY